MKKLMKGFLAMILAVMMLISVTACDASKKYGQWYDKKAQKVDQTHLFGVCGLLIQNYWNTGLPWKESIDLYDALGVKTVRNWMHINWLLSDPTTVKTDVADWIHDSLKHQIDLGMRPIGVSFANLHPDGYVNSSVGSARPARDLTEGSMYMQWLNDYEQSWYTMATEFPEVMFWEIDNENNNPAFCVKLDGGQFSKSQAAAIFTDMLFFASRGIHRANPKATTIMGGLTPETAAGFFQLMYDCIFAEGSWSPYPDDYFQIAAWHPFSDGLNASNATSLNTWLTQQKRIYDVIKKNEGKDKKVFFTAVGWSDISTGEKAKLANIEALYTLAKTELKFVESIFLFRPFDYSNATWASVKEKTFGLFNDPTDVMPGKTAEEYVLGAPKEAAYLYQRLAGGTGDLTIMQKWAVENAQK